MKFFIIAFVFSFLNLLKCQTKIEMDTYEYVNDKIPPNNLLMQHTLNLKKNPHNLTELKICLMKSYIQDKSSFPIFILAKYTLFGYPLVIKAPKNLENSTFCNDIDLKTEYEKRKFQQMVLENQLDNFKTNISLSFLYFNEAHKLGHKEAPAYLYFLLQQNLIYKDFLSHITPLFPSDLYKLNLLTVGHNRGSYLATLLFLSETLKCYHHNKFSYSESFSKILKPSFSEFIKGPYLSGNCNKCSDILNMALILGSEALLYLQKQGGQGDAYPSFDTLKSTKIEEKENLPKKNDLYNDEIYLLESSARLGNVLAQQTLGQLFFFGNPALNVPRDMNRAAELFSQAASQNDARSHHNLGLMQANGIGTNKNGTLAKENFEKAIDLGLKEGHSGLGFIYLNGIGVNKNISKAIEHYENAAHAGDAEALSNLGALQMEEMKNEEQAVIYFKRAAKKKQLSAMYNLGVLYLRGVKMNMTCEEILELQLEVCLRVDKMKLKKKALKNFLDGNFIGSLLVTSLGALTSSHYHHKNLEFLLKQPKINVCMFEDSDLCRIVYLYQGFLRDTDKIHVFGLKLADLLFSGSKNLKTNYNLSISFYKEMENFFPEAKHSLSFMYEYGYGVPIDLEKSKEIIEKLRDSAWKEEIGFENFWPAIFTNVKLEIKILLNKLNKYIYDFYES